MRRERWEALSGRNTLLPLGGLRWTDRGLHELVIALKSQSLHLPSWHHFIAISLHYSHVQIQMRLLFAIIDVFLMCGAAHTRWVCGTCAQIETPRLFWILIECMSCFMDALVSVCNTAVSIAFWVRKWLRFAFLSTFNAFLASIVFCVAVCTKKKVMAFHTVPPK